MKKLFLIDAFALIFRYYYAFIARPMRNGEGLNTSAIYGFTKYVLDIIRDEKPDMLGVAFDPRGGNFRHEMYAEYKANRDATPEDIIASVPYIKEILKAMNIHIMEVAGYEADDVIGTIAKRMALEGCEVYMVTPDKDYGQLVDDNIHMYKQKKGGVGVEIISKSNIEAHYKISDPTKIIDILALWGDQADNVPGVTGVGEKTAIKLVSTYGTVEEILADTSRIKGKMRDNIEAAREMLPLSKALVTIDTNVPIDCDTEVLKVKSHDTARLLEVYTKLNFYSLISDMQASDSHFSRGAKEGYTNHKVASNTDYSNELWCAGGEPNLFSSLGEEPTLTTVDETKESVVATPTNLSLFDIIDSPAEALKDINTVNHHYNVVQGTELDKLIDLLLMQEAVCFDTETTSLDAMSAKLVGMSFCWEEHKAYYVPYSEEALKTLSPFFTNAKIAKIGQNLKYDMLVLKNHGVEVLGELWDTMVMHYLINSDERHGMDYLSEKYLQYSPIPISQLIGKGTGKNSMDECDISAVAEYAAEDADVTYQLYKCLLKELKETDMLKLYITVEQELIRVLTDMEYAGVKLDTARLDNYAEVLSTKLDELTAKISDVAQDPSLNINSPKQLGELLFDKLKIVDKPKRTKTKQYKTDEEYLSSLKDKHDIVAYILEYRGVKKLLSTYVAALPKLINPATGRVHTSYNQAVTTTGRLSSTNPNLQNIPIREEQGREIRASFIACKGWSILSADYSQVELRVMAHLSGDTAMCEAFTQGEDIHTATAAKIYKVDPSEVTSAMRRNAKSANFGIIYGISSFGLANNLGITNAEARALIDGYFSSYPQVKAFMDSSIDLARQKGYALTLYGRKRYLADINSGNKTVASYAERNAINAPIQGTAADIMKIAMCRVYNKLKSEKLLSRLIMQVHDEVIVETAPGEEERVKQIVISEMEHAAELRVPLSADCGIATNWLDAH